jgi:anaerobic dimethyl sulfoxide reductase subunit A
MPPLHACVRGFGQVERMNHPDRVTHPLRRVGPRGAGQFERIGWDEALDEVARQMRRVRETYGPAAILDASRSGNTAMLHNRASLQRLLYMFGGCTELWSNISAEAEVFAVRETFGQKADYKSAGREAIDYVNSKLIVMWGWSPGDGHFGTGVLQYLKRAKQHGVRIVCVDPRRTRSSSMLADEHLFIRPSTDTAALLAMAYVIVTEGLHDQAFLDRYVQGFDEATLPPGAPAGASYRSYLLGLGPDGVKKTPEWAAAITGMPAESIRRLAIEYATAKPAALHCGYAPGRTIHGEQFHRAAYALASMTGNVGIAGGNSGVSNGATGRCGIKMFSPGTNPAGARVASSLLADLLDRGRAGGYPADIKMIYSVAGDLFNQLPNIRKTVAAAERVEFIVVQDHFVTPTARYADVVLPATTFWERNDLHTPWNGGGHYVFFMNKAVEPAGECRNDLDICADLARRLGITGYNDKTEEQWLRELSDGVIDDFETFRAHGLARLPAPEDAVAFAREIRDPERYPFTTPSGKIEIYATRLAEHANLCGLGPIAPIPTWIPDREDPRHPLRLLSPKSRARTHSIHGNQPTLERADRDDVWIHPDDAFARGILDGQRVAVYNDRGVTVLPARVTDRMAPGVVAIKEGAWFVFDDAGQEQRGCANVLIEDRASPAGASAFNSCFVEVAPVKARRPWRRRQGRGQVKRNVAP